MTESRADVRGPVAGHLAGYRRALAELGYSGRAIRTHVELLGDLSGWLQGEGLDLAGLTADRVAEFLGARRRRGGRGLVTAFGVGPLLGYLAGVGVLPSQARSGPVGPAAALLSRYREYLVSERGMAAAGVVRYECVAQLFVRLLAVGGDVDWSAVTGADVSRFLVKECTGCGGSSARNLVAGLRSFLRFAQLEGCTAVGLSWRCRRWTAAGIFQGKHASLNCGPAGCLFLTTDPLFTVRFCSPRRSARGHPHDPDHPSS